MKKASMMVLAAVILAAMAASAQTPPMPKPGPEVEKLNYFLGNWKESLEVKPGHMGPGGKGAETAHAEWAPGGFFIVIRSAADMGAMGKFTSTAYIGYNAQDKVYTYDEFASTGEHTIAKGTVEGDTWTWTNESKMDGKTMNGRFIEKITSPNSYDLKYEASMDGGEYTTFMDGQATKSAGASAAKPAGAGPKGAEKPAGGAAAKPAAQAAAADSESKTPKAK